MLKSWNTFCMTWHWFVNVLLDSIYWVCCRIFALAFMFLKQMKLFSASVPRPVGPSAKTFFSWSFSAWFLLSVQFLVQRSSSLLSLPVFTISLIPILYLHIPVSFSSGHASLLNHLLPPFFLSFLPSSFLHSFSPLSFLSFWSSPKECKLHEGSMCLVSPPWPSWVCAS